MREWPVGAWAARRLAMSVVTLAMALSSASAGGDGVATHAGVLPRRPVRLATGCRPSQIELVGGRAAGSSMRREVTWSFFNRRDCRDATTVQAQCAEGPFVKCVTVRLASVGDDVWASSEDAQYVVAAEGVGACDLLGRLDFKLLSRDRALWRERTTMAVAEGMGAPGYGVADLAFRVRDADKARRLSVTPPRISVLADRRDGLYRCGEPATLTIRAEPEAVGAALAGDLVLTVSDFSSEASPSLEVVSLETSRVFRVTRTLARPGFLRLCVEDGFSPKPRQWTVGFDVAGIRKGSPTPADFADFWHREMARARREVPLDPEMVRVPERSTTEYDVYRISFASFGRRVYGTLSIPAGKGPHPLNVQLASAGFADFANFGGVSPRVAMLWFSVFPFRPDWEWRRLNLVEKFEAMNRDLECRWGTGWPAAGLGGRRTDYFFHPVIIAAARAVDWVAARPEIDARDIVYNGGSQGGGLGMMVVALNGNFRKAYFSVPALTDTMGWLAGRESGWPRAYESRRRQPDVSANYRANMPYYDAANFCRLIRCPVRVTLGMRDTVVPPTAVCAAFNEIASADKRLICEFESGHGIPDRVLSRWAQWLEEDAPGKAGAPLRKGRLKRKATP